MTLQTFFLGMLLTCAICSTPAPYELRNWLDTAVSYALVVFSDLCDHLATWAGYNDERCPISIEPEYEGTPFDAYVPDAEEREMYFTHGDETFEGDPFDMPVFEKEICQM